MGLANTGRQLDSEPFPVRATIPASLMLPGASHLLALSVNPRQRGLRMTATAPAIAAWTWTATTDRPPLELPAAGSVASLGASFVGGGSELCHHDAS